MRFKVFTPIIIVFFFLILRFWRRVDVLVVANVSEKHTVSIFQGVFLSLLHVDFSMIHIYI
jgi:hypothetical protein